MWLIQARLSPCITLFASGRSCPLVEADSNVDFARYDPPFSAPNLSTNALHQSSDVASRNDAPERARVFLVNENSPDYGRSPTTLCSVGVSIGGKAMARCYFAPGSEMTDTMDVKFLEGHGGLSRAQDVACFL
ncbi:hypothetical protein B0H17DRAFT_1216226 [Mycena rosella]|uniref:Uncharacterized protein n=1 Tax=Mycena rosella TaxID=1033263 RepID=A0AAD7CA22_MYCRO|nr:hypothetical protein B0H17DRAFT_1216226 [Mycena rosella]